MSGPDLSVNQGGGIGPRTDAAAVVDVDDAPVELGQRLVGARDERAVEPDPRRLVESRLALRQQLKRVEQVVAPALDRGADLSLMWFNKKLE